MDNDAERKPYEEKGVDNGSGFMLTRYDKDQQAWEAIMVDLKAAQDDTPQGRLNLTMEAFFSDVMCNYRGVVADNELKDKALERKGVARKAKWDWTEEYTKQPGFHRFVYVDHILEMALLLKWRRQVQRKCKRGDTKGLNILGCLVKGIPAIAKDIGGGCGNTKARRVLKNLCTWGYVYAGRIVNLKKARQGTTYVLGRRVGMSAYSWLKPPTVLPVDLEEPFTDWPKWVYDDK